MFLLVSVSSQVSLLVPKLTFIVLTCPFRYRMLSVSPSHPLVLPLIQLETLSTAASQLAGYCLFFISILRMRMWWSLIIESPIEGIYCSLLYCTITDRILFPRYFLLSSIILCHISLLSSPLINFDIFSYPLICIVLSTIPFHLTLFYSILFFFNPF